LQISGEQTFVSGSKACTLYRLLSIEKRLRGKLRSVGSFFCGRWLARIGGTAT
jgi:hypothetical protein